MLGTWLGRVVGIGISAVAIAACSNSTSNGGDDSSGDDTGDGGGGGGGGDSGTVDAGGDSSVNNRVTGDAGQCLSNCHEGDPCSTADQCASGTCTAGACADPSCTDGKKDGTETAPDCGGTCAACADGLACLIGADCVNQVCDPTTKTCSPPTATDTVKNGSETDTDCGDSGAGEADDAPPCADGKACTVGTDCVDKECGANKTCTPASCSDGVQNGTETALDCGGMCNACADGLGCAVNADCTSKSCDTTAIKLCLPPTDTDHLWNGNETDVDCGSGGTGEDTKAPACADGKMCKAGSDCVDLICGADGTCAAASCTDLVKNGGETDKDCGGGAKSGCKACPDLEGCKANSDCLSLSCDTTTDACLKPTDTDKIKNGNESDVDCGSGGTNDGSENTHAPLCASGKACISHADCVDDGCNYKGLCITEPSCAQHSGGDTCGAGETDETTGVDETAAVHESCCASVTLPSSTTRLDKYEITAGRMREFVNRTGGNIAAFWAAYAAAHPGSVAVGQIRAQDVQYLPTDNDGPYLATFTYNYKDNDKVTQGTGLGLGLYNQIGASVIFSDEPSDEQGCYVGATGSGSYGHPTYWWDATTMVNQFGGGARAFSQVELDEKSLNCVTEMMLVAFCAWDGGHLATDAELDAAYGSAKYPWGAAPAYTDTWTTTVPGRTNPVYDPTGSGKTTTNTSYWTVNMPLNNGQSGLASVDLLAPTYTPTNWNPFFPTIPSSLRYYWPPISPDLWGNQVDEAYEIAAPGRFVNDKSTLGAWYDLAANIIEISSTVVSTDDANHDSLPKVHWHGGSFEGHGVGKETFTENIMTKYGKTGGRCAR